MEPERPPDNPATLLDWLWRLKRYEHGIYVRHQGMDGKWRSLSLAEVPPKKWAECVARWLEDGTLPVCVKEPWEINDGGQGASREQEASGPYPEDQEGGESAAG